MNERDPTGREGDVVRAGRREVARTVTGDRRAQSTVLAVVLLVGIVGTMSVGLVLMANASIDSTQQAAEDDRVEQAFLSLDGHVDAVARSENGTTRTIDLQLSGSEGAVRKEGTGRIVVNTSNRSSPVIDQPLGAIEYENGETTIAYQAGAVWRNSGNDTVMVSNPDLKFRNRRGADHTLTLPITSFEGDEHLSGGEVTIRKNRTVSPLSDVRLVQGETVTVNITSRYYVGWAEYFREDVNDVAIQEIDHDENRVIVALGRPEIDATIEHGVLATGGPDADVSVDGRGSGGVDGDVAAEGEVDGEGDISGDVEEHASNDLMELDTVIHQKVDWAQDNASVQELDPADSSYVLDGGDTYYAEGIDGDGVTVDLSEGDVSLVLDGDVTLENTGGITVENPGDNVTRIYATGNVSLANVDVYVDGGESRHLQIYGTSEMLIGVGNNGNAYFEGLIYAPRSSPALDDGEANPLVSGGGGGSSCTADVCIVGGGGASAIEGAIVAGPMTFDSNADLDYDEDLSGMNPDLEIRDGVYPPPITYLHASVHEVDIESAD